VKRQRKAIDEHLLHHHLHLLYRRQAGTIRLAGNVEAIGIKRDMKVYVEPLKVTQSDISCQRPQNSPRVELAVSNESTGAISPPGTAVTVTTGCG